MIEVEKKFILSDEDRATLLNGAMPVGVKKFTDVYFDTADYALTKMDWWLRERDGRFELKVPADKVNRDVETNQYHEFETEAEIKEKLSIETDRPLKEVLDGFGYVPFATIATTREKFKKEGFTIDVDEMDFGFHVAEVEVMVNEKDDVELAKRLIFEFAERHKLAVKPTRGKVLEYLARYSEDHFHALETAWGIKI